VHSAAARKAGAHGSSTRMLAPDTAAAIVLGAGTVKARREERTPRRGGTATAAAGWRWRTRGETLHWIEGRLWSKTTRTKPYVPPVGTLSSLSVQRLGLCIVVWAGLARAKEHPPPGPLPHISLSLAFPLGRRCGICYTRLV
jgi:hypothetical protein